MTRLLPSMTALQCFEAVARHLSATRAAEELHLTQSAVSKQIAQLEATLGRDVFVRIRKRLRLTPAGEIYLAEIKRILTQVDMSSRYVSSYGGDTEVLTVATSPTFGSRWLIPGLKGFGAKHPNIHLDIRNAQSGIDLQADSADVIFYYGTAPLPGAQCRPLFGEALIAVCAPDLLHNGTAFDLHPASARAPAASATQAARPVLLQCSARPEAWREWFLSQGLNADRSYHGPRFQTFDMCLCAARAGCGVALVPRFMAEADLRTGALVPASTASQVSPGSYYVACAEHTADTPKINALIDWVLEKAAATAPGQGAVTASGQGSVTARGQGSVTVP